ncbi:MAG TPA: ATP-binding cassette domain-containing protein [Bacteroidaceae bacterium]|nr:ATP-binding cassette domain-containing protein [Bacteroidaceae bacterium]
MNLYPLVDIQSAWALYADVQLTNPLTWAIYPGQQIAIYGPNASGKSNLIQLILGVHALQKGRITWYNEKGEVVPGYKQVATLCYRDGYGGADKSYYHQQRWHSTDVEHLELVNGKPIVALSCGELRLYHLKQVLSNKPRLLVLDNPFIGLDEETRQHMDHLLTLITQEGHTQLIVLGSRWEDFPSCITHVAEVKDRAFVACWPLDEYKLNLQEKVLEQIYLGNRKINNQIPFPVCSDEKFQNNDEVVVSMRDVTIRYGKFTILDGLNWVVKRGIHCVLKGPNGSGKSTLISLVCADNPQGYSVDMDLFGVKRGSGESIWDIKQKIGYFSPELHRAYNKPVAAIEIVASGLHDRMGLYRAADAGQLLQAQIIMERLEIVHLRKRLFTKLSSGEQRMVLLARAFVKNPELLILDEPHHGLDQANRALVSEYIRHFTSQPRHTLIYVSHDETEESYPICGSYEVYSLKRNQD